MAEEKLGSTSGKGGKKSAPTPAAKPKPTGKMSYKDQREYDNLPGQIAKLEAEIAEIEAALSDGSLFTKDPDAFQKKVDRMAAARAELEAAKNAGSNLKCSARNSGCHNTSKPMLYGTIRIGHNLPDS